MFWLYKWTLQQPVDREPGETDQGGAVLQVEGGGGGGLASPALSRVSACLCFEGTL